MKKYYQKYRVLFVCSLSVVVATLAVFVIDRTNEIKSGSEIVIGQADQSLVGEIAIKVDIQGAVNQPGVYEVKIGTVVEEAINAAGGLSDAADLLYISQNINNAREVVDGEKIYIPREGEQSTVVSGQPDSTQGKININTATATELDTLPRIGPAYAQKIIDARPFVRIEDIKNVKGIGDSIFQDIKDLICV